MTEEGTLTASWAVSEPFYTSDLQASAKYATGLNLRLAFVSVRGFSLDHLRDSRVRPSEASARRRNTTLSRRPRQPLMGGDVLRPECL
jgi:hypothetical protein